MKLEEFIKLPNYVELVEVELRKVAAEKPDFVYNPNKGSCSYIGPATSYIEGSQVGPDCDGCIFGAALQRCGVDKSCLGAANKPIDELIEDCPDNWQDVQDAQDGGESWGEAIKEL